MDKEKVIKLAWLLVIMLSVLVAGLFYGTAIFLLDITSEPYKSMLLCEDLGFDGYDRAKETADGYIACYNFMEDKITKNYTVVEVNKNG